MNINKLHNLGIIAHVDAGKTTFTERLLFVTGKRHYTGEVHNGESMMDHRQQEKDRGITIESTATSIFWNDAQLNIIDTPGHIDFNIEVNRSLRVLDGAVVVFDAVAGVEPQTEVNWILADKYRVPRIGLINKMDRIGANFSKVVQQMESTFAQKPLPLQMPIIDEDGFTGIIDLLNMHSAQWSHLNQIDDFVITEIPEQYKVEAELAREQLVERLAAEDEAILESWAEGKIPANSELVAAIRRQTIAGKIVPIFAASAYKNIGIQPALDAITQYLPMPIERPESVDNLTQKLVTNELDGAFAALVFKVVNDPHGSLAYTRVYRGQLQRADKLLNTRTTKVQKVGPIYEMHANIRTEKPAMVCGDIVAIAGLKDVQTGDTLCAEDMPVAFETITAPEPVMEMAIEPGERKNQTKFSLALQALCREDPSLQIKTDSRTGQTCLAGMGELHLEIAIDRLKTDFGITTRVGAPQVAHRETLIKATEVHALHRKQTGGLGQFAEVKLQFIPFAKEELDSSNAYEEVIFENKIIGGVIPQEFIPAVEAGIRQSANEGIVSLYPCGGFKVELIDGSYHQNDSSPMAFSLAAKQAVKKLKETACIQLLEPIMKIDINIPSEHIGSVIGDINRRRGQVIEQNNESQRAVLKAQAPLAEMFGYIGCLRALTAGRGQFTMSFSHYETVPSMLITNIIGDKT
ncbi:elongation factor G [Spartinivicinus poritis]|uniref:Elongation factor G n=1 Tax=Spartinivicinus poritis TaxID=2994640 RepID=A0ABT5U679_9GAMM|nr:elongation factor G [Spartinivicinus sp. A2-2]MDE1461873.1 elongation factor G [Spartinivicinus sp. A2-2]